MKKVLLILSTVFSMLLIGCSSGSDDFDSDFTIKGYVVTAPANTPLSGVLVRVTNDSYTLGSTSSNADGSFTLTINRSELDNSYFLSLLDPKTEVTKHIDIKGVGMSEYNFGNIALYDSRNPYELPTFNYNGYTYIVHPVLRREYALSELNSACDGLNDYGRDDWFLPNEAEMRKIIDMIWLNKTFDLIPAGLYWTSDFDGRYTTYLSYNGQGGVSNKSGSSNPNQMAHVVPISCFK